MNKDPLEGISESEDESPVNGERTSGGDPGRFDHSLGSLTTKFLAMIQNTETRCVDLNEAARVKPTQVLNVQKRRIYDITNVLEGIGLVQKKHKNRIQWIGNSEFAETDQSQTEGEPISLEEQKLDLWIGKLEDSINQMTLDPSYKEYAYVTYDDIKSISGLTEGLNETLIAIRAPPGTTLEAPDASQIAPGAKYQVSLHSKTGEILVYVISKDPDQSDDTLGAHCFFTER